MNFGGIALEKFQRYIKMGEFLKPKFKVLKFIEKWWNYWKVFQIKYEMISKHGYLKFRWWNARNPLKFSEPLNFDSSHRNSLTWKLMKSAFSMKWVFWQAEICKNAQTKQKNFVKDDEDLRDFRDGSDHFLLEWITPFSILIVNKIGGKW